jgi:hypothetical protein
MKIGRGGGGIGRRRGLKILRYVSTLWVRPPPALQMAILGFFWLKTQYIGVFGKENYLESPLGVIFR